MVSKIILTSLLLAFCCAAYVCSAQMVGGLHDEKPADDEVRKAVSNVKGDIDRMANTEFQSLEPISYRKQIVAGANYYVRALATSKDGSKSHVHLRIYKPFRGPMELTAIRTNQDKQKPLEYFQ